VFRRCKYSPVSARKFERMLTPCSFDLADQPDVPKSPEHAIALLAALEKLPLADVEDIEIRDLTTWPEDRDVGQVANKLSAIWIPLPPGSPGAGGLCQLRERCIKRIAADVPLSLTGIALRKHGNRRARDELAKIKREAETAEEEISRSELRAMSQSRIQTRDEPEDEVLRRISLYPLAPLEVPVGLQWPSRIVQSWPIELGSDPWQHFWLHEDERQLEEERSQRLEKEIAKRKRRAEFKASLRAPIRLKEEAGPSTQPLPFIAGSSQPVLDPRSTQSQGQIGMFGESQSQGMGMWPVEPMSQVVPGRFGQRMQLPERKKRKITASKKAGFK
jgi:hypothetical protein